MHIRREKESKKQNKKLKETNKLLIKEVKALRSKITLKDKKIFD